MGAADQVHIVLLQEARHDVRPERETNTSIILTPAGDVLVGVRPQQVTQQTAVRNLHPRVSTNIVVWICVPKEKLHDERGKVTYVSGAHNPTNLLHRVQVWAQATVHGEDLLVNDGGNRQAVEAISKCLPQLDIVPTLALVVETVNAVDRGALVITAQNEEVLGVLDLVRQQEADGLKRLLATVNVVTKEEVVCLWRETAVLEQPQKIIVLPMNVTADL